MILFSFSLSVVLTPLDAVYTRMGARDNLMTGHSTFLTELIETANILRHSSPRSLVILDGMVLLSSTPLDDPPYYCFIHPFTSLPLCSVDQYLPVPLSILIIVATIFTSLYLFSLSL